MNRKNLYDVLRVDKSASSEDIKQAFRREALKHHPDRNAGGQEAARRFREAAAAYEVLGDPRARAGYDHGLEREARDSESRRQARPTRQDASPRSQGPAPTRGADRTYDVVITWREAARGGRLTLRLPSSRPCATCRGTGHPPGPRPSTCPHCGGRGEVRTMLGPIAVLDTCPACRGSGGHSRAACPACNGLGMEPGGETLDLRLPPGMYRGGGLRMRGRGEPGLGGGPPGDLLVRIHVDQGPAWDAGARSYAPYVFPWLVA